MYREQGGTPSKTIEELRAELAAKRAENEASEQAERDADELQRLQREMAIEDAKKAARAQGVRQDLLLSFDFAGIGPCLGKVPTEVVYKRWTVDSGLAKGDMKPDLEPHYWLAHHVMIVPNGKEFVALCRERNPGAVVGVANAVVAHQQNKAAERGK